jgi:hypothetical protein
MFFLWTAFSGWTATLFLGAGIGIPYVGRSLGLASLRPHYWLGFLVPAIAFLHAWLPMSAGHMRGFNQTGLLLATAALFVMLWQMGLGLTLRAAKGIERRNTRRIHLATMLIIVALVAGHVVLNRA